MHACKLSAFFIVSRCGRLYVAGGLYDYMSASLNISETKGDSRLFPIGSL